MQTVRWISLQDHIRTHLTKYVTISKNPLTSCFEDPTQLSRLEASRSSFAYKLRFLSTAPEIYSSSCVDLSMGAASLPTPDRWIPSPALRSYPRDATSKVSACHLPGRDVQKPRAPSWSTSGSIWDFRGWALDFGLLSGWASDFGK